MKTYCVKCRKDTENIDPKMVRTKKIRLIMQSKCSVCGTKKSRFMKEQEAKGLKKTKKQTKNSKFMQTGNTDFIYNNEIDKACFPHDMAYGKTKDLVKRTQSDKVLRDKAFKIASDPKYHGYQRELGSMVYKFLIKNLLH